MNKEFKGLYFEADKGGAGSGADKPEKKVIKIADFDCFEGDYVKIAVTPAGAMSPYRTVLKIEGIAGGDLRITSTNQQKPIK